MSVLGLIGGYLTPLLLPGGGTVLWIYLILLGGGVLFLSVFRQWFLLNLLALLFTGLHIFLMLETVGPAQPLSAMLPFLVILFVIFSSAAFLFQLLQAQKSTWLDLGFLFLNVSLFFGNARRLLLLQFPPEVLSILSLALALFYGLHLWFFHRQARTDKGLALCFLSLTCFFLILTLPLLLSQVWWSAGWAVLAWVLLYASQKAESHFLENVAFGLFALTLFRFLTLDLSFSYAEPPLAGQSLGDFLGALMERAALLGTPLGSFAGALWLQHRPAQPYPGFNLSGENDMTDQLSAPGDSPYSGAFLRWEWCGADWSNGSVPCAGLDCCSSPEWP